jgi:hypothetical protein
MRLKKIHNDPPPILYGVVLCGSEFFLQRFPPPIIKGDIEERKGEQGKEKI